MNNNSINNAAMDPIWANISSRRNTIGLGPGSGHLARYQSAAFVAARSVPTPMWQARRLLRAIQANDPIAVSWEGSGGGDGDENGLWSAVVKVLDAAKVAFTMVCPFGMDLLDGHATLSGPLIDCGAALVVTVRRGSLAVEAAEHVVYQLCQILLRYVCFLPISS